MTPPAPAPRPLAAAPRLVFEIRRTIATMTSAGPGNGYASIEVVLLADAALELQRELGPDLFTVLLTVALSSTERDGEMVTEGPTPVVVGQTGWHRVRVSKMLTGLQAAGFLSLEQHAIPGQKGFTKTMARLAPDLYRRVDRRMSVVTHERTSGAPPAGLSDPYNVPTTAGGNGVTEPDTVPGDGVAKHDTVRPNAVTQVDTARPNAVAVGDSVDIAAGRNAVDSSGVAGPGSVAGPNGAGPGDSVSGRWVRVVPGRGAVDSSDTVAPRHLHEDGDDECHSSRGDDHDPGPAPAQGTLRPVGGPLVDGTAALAPAAAVAALVGRAPTVRVEEVPHLRPDALRELLASWGVFDVDRLLTRYPTHVLTYAVQSVITRWQTVENPGAYLRKVLRQADAPPTSGSPAPPSRPSTAEPGTADAPARRPAPPPAVDTDPEPVPPEVLAAALAACPPQVRQEVEAVADAALANVPDNLRGLTALVNAYRRNALAEALRDRGLLPPPAGT